MRATQSEPLSDGSSMIIDTDVHQSWASSDEFVEYLPEHFTARGLTPPGGPGYSNPVSHQGIARNDAIPENGLPGSSYELMEAQLFGDFGVDFAVLTGPIINDLLARHPNVHYAKAAVEAFNDWQIDRWLDRDDRFLGSIMVAPSDPVHAQQEIKRVGSHDQMVQVMLPGAHEAPYGAPQYWPIYEAAAAASLPIAVHSTSANSGLAWAPCTGAGVPRSYMSKHVLMRAPGMGQLVSTVTEGVFVEYPDLDWIYLEQGIAWLPFVYWLMDKNWKGLKDTVPWLERRPTEYIRDNVWFSTQPMPEPEKPEFLPMLLEMIHAEDVLVFSSDYPHWDNDDPKAVFNGLGEELRTQIMGENAREIYDL